MNKRTITKREIFCKNSQMFVDLSKDGEATVITLNRVTYLAFQSFWLPYWVVKDYGKVYYSLAELLGTTSEGAFDLPHHKPHGWKKTNWMKRKSWKACSPAELARRKALREQKIGL